MELAQAKPSPRGSAGSAGAAASADEAGGHRVDGRNGRLGLELGFNGCGYWVVHPTNRKWVK